MEKKHLQLGDLVSLEGLEKPGEDVVKLELGGKKIGQLGEEMSDLAGTIEDNKNVQVGQLAGLVEGLKKAMQRELSPEKAAELMKTLKKRFLDKKKPYKAVEGVKWKDVQKKLEDSPEKLWSLQQMEETRGEPDIMDYDKKTAEYIFMDCSAESPEGRRNCVYDREGEEILKRDYPDEKCDGNAESRAALMGIEILNEKEYRDLQTKGEFDRNNWSWIKTPVDRRKAGVALVGYRNRFVVFVGEGNPNVHDDVRAWRGGLRV